MSNPTSLAVGVVKVTDQNRQDIGKAKFRRTYEAEGCGICEKPGAEIFWFNPVSRYAHSACYGEIKNIETNLIAKINSVFKGTNNRNIAHVRAIRAVKKELGGISIKTFLETNGADKLKSIFDSDRIVTAATLIPKL